MVGDDERVPPPPSPEPPGPESPGPELGELQELLLATDTLEEFLGAVAAAAARDLGADVSCGVTVRTHQRRPTTLGVSDGYAAALDEVQYAQGQGPCLHALASGERVEILDLAADPRWPRFGALAAGQGVVAMLSTPMRTARTGTVGALNLYAREQRVLDRDRAGRFAELAAAAIAIGIRLAQRAELSEDLRTALSSRSVIDQALGVVMGQRRCGPDEAFTVLRELSQTTNTKLREVAAQVIATLIDADPPSGTPPR